MQWTRSLGARAVALAACAVIVASHWAERNGWFWLGVVGGVLNLVGLVVHLGNRSAGRADVLATPAPARSATAPEADDDAPTLSQLLLDPAVAEALDAGPTAWQQVSYRDDASFGPVAPRDLMDEVWIERGWVGEDDWAVALGEDLKPYLDLDLDENDDPVLAVPRSHPHVAGAWHEDREVYAARVHRPMTVVECGALAARALVAHQVAAAARLDTVSGPDGTSADPAGS